MSSAESERVCSCEKSNVVSRRQPKDPLHLTAALRHLGQSSFPNCGSVQYCWWQQPGTKLTLIFNRNHSQFPESESAVYWGQVSLVLTRFCTWCVQRYQVPFCSKSSLKGCLYQSKTPQDWDGVCFQNNTANVFFQSQACSVSTTKAWGP